MLIQYARLAIRVIFAFFIFLISSTHSFAQVSEMCNNGIDDDGDGLIDAYDLLDCPGVQLEFCTDTVRSHNFDIQLAWSAPENLPSAYNATPVVGNLNPGQDSIPEIVVASIPTPWVDDTTYEMFIFKGDGSNRANPNRLTITAGISNVFNEFMSNTPTIADLDADGNPELIVLCADKRIRIYHGFDPTASPCMSLWITAIDTCRTNQFDVSAADFDNDGISELYAGNEVYVLDLSVPGVPALRRRLRGTGPFGRVYWDGLTPFGKGVSFAADLLSVADCNGDPDCNGLEIAAGYVIYSVDIDPNDGDGYQIKIQRDLNALSGEPFLDGMTTVADVNLDGIPEVLVTSGKGAQHGFYFWNKTGYWRFFASDQMIASPTYATGSKLVVGNIYDDRKAGFTQDFPEILANDEGSLTCINMQRASVSPATPYWWKYGIENTYNGIYTPALFDFDMDGYSEVVLPDYEPNFQSQFFFGLAVLYGGPAPFPAGVDAKRRYMIYKNYQSSSLFGSPVIADVDADGQAEIIDSGSPAIVNQAAIHRIHVLEAEEVYHTTWPSARQVWNQYAYNIVNVNDDLSIPKNQQPGYVEMPTPGSGIRPLNSFNGQSPYYGYQHPKHLTTGDAKTQVLEVACIGNLQFRIKVRVCNQGAIALPPNLPMTFYRNGNPYTGPATSMGTFIISPGPIVPGGCADLTVVLPFTASMVYAVANDPGIGIFPLHDSDQFWKAECNYVNNFATFKMNPALAPALSLGPDLIGCLQGVQTLQASPGFATYVWQNGATGPTFAASMPGTFWVVATDFCSNVRRDTVQILVDTVLQRIDVTVCAGDAYTFNGVPIADGTSQSFVYTTTAGCDSTILVTVNSTMADQTTETVRICPGDSVLVFGSLVATAGAYSQQYTNNFGCDSIHTVTLELYALPVSTNDLRQLCPGDSTIVFGTTVTTAGVYTQQFSNINGCDSTHTITVEMLAAPVSTTELRQICAGDSTIVFGTVIKTAGVYSQLLSAVNGCDSLHTITVSLLNLPTPTSETRQLCPGDLIVVFGTVVQTAGVYSQAFSAVNGCDSIHTVTVSLLNLPTPTDEMRQLCPGDSVQVFGNYVQTAGSYTQHYSSFTGCDSVHTVTVSLLAAVVPTQEIRQICAGDSTLVFGSIIHAAGVFMQAFSNINGCDSLHTVTVSVFAVATPTQETRAICTGDSTLVFGTYVTTPGMYAYHFQNANGCDSLHTVTVDLLPGPVPTAEMRQICPGDSTLVFGQYRSMPGLYTGQFPGNSGCDSLHTITVALFPTPVSTSENRQICPGDSVQVFGQYIYTAGVYSQLFSNTNGCDSVHAITVSLYVAPVPTQEARYLCPGDSTVVFGTIVYAANTFTQTFSNSNGCDSTHTVTVSLYAMPVPTQETRSLCPGDSTLIFGVYVNTPGLYSQTMPNIHGCDSTHTVEVIETFLFEQHDTLALCPGDSVRVFGNWIHVPGNLQQTVSGAPGCDTLYSVTIKGIDAPVVLPVIVQPDAQRPTGSITVFVVQGALYSLDALKFSSQTVFDNLQPGDYVLYQQFEGCVQPLPFRIVPFNQPDTSGVYAPNALQPGSGHGNDVFTLFAAPGTVNELVYLQIYDRWGALVFECRSCAANDVSKGWDGYIGRKPAAPGVYIWQAMVEFKNGERVVKKGDLTIVP